MRLLRAPNIVIPELQSMASCGENTSRILVTPLIVHPRRPVAAVY